MKVDNIAAESKARDEAIDRLAFHVFIAIVTGILLFFAMGLLTADAYNEYLRSLQESQGLFATIFGLTTPMSQSEYVFFHCYGYISTIVAVVWIVVAIGFFYPGPRSPELIEWEAANEEAECEAEREENEGEWGKEWLAEVRMRPKPIGCDKECIRHSARLEIVNYFVDRKITLDQDPFQHRGFECRGRTGIKDNHDLLDHAHNAELHNEALLLYIFRSYDYGRAALKAQAIASELQEQLKLLDLVSVEVFRFEQTSASADGPGALDSAINFALGAAVFTGAAFVGYKLLKGASEATLGRAGKVVDAVTHRIEPNRH